MVLCEKYAKMVFPRRDLGTLGFYKLVFVGKNRKYLRKILTKKSSQKKPGKNGGREAAPYFVDEGVFRKIFSLIFCVNIFENRAPQG